MTRSIGFIGAGRMASAICDGLLKTGTNYSICAHDPMLEGETWGHRPCELVSIEELMNRCEWVVWSIKPQVFSTHSLTWKKLHFKGKGMISVMAGIATSSIEAFFDHVPVIRTMPNTPMMNGEGMVALAMGSHARTEHLDEVEHFFKPVAVTLRVEEQQLDGVTAISGSGPAYAFYLAEEIAKRSQELGLDAKTAIKLWAQTLKGAAAMLEENQDPQALRAQVTSPGGTTHAAIETFKTGLVAENFGRGLTAAHQRSLELSGS